MEAHEVIEPVEVWVKVVMGGWIFKAKAQRRNLGQKYLFLSHQYLLVN